ncbi:MAG TPA: hypothetical protein VFG87_29055 [Amycolatopsis sp.]|jgi:hypothetical protein|nr:hypothetical protein [Amycolatopsis sp.]
MRTKVKALGPVNVASGPIYHGEAARWLSPVRDGDRKIGLSVSLGRRWWVAAFWHRARRYR